MILGPGAALLFPALSLERGWGTKNKKVSHRSWLLTVNKVDRHVGCVPPSSSSAIVRRAVRRRRFVGLVCFLLALDFFSRTTGRFFFLLLRFVVVSLPD